MIFLVINYEGEHAAEHGSGLLAVGLVSLENDFGVGIGLERTSVLLDQILADLLIIVNLTVKYNDMLSICAVNRLCAALQVNDTQTAETKCCIIIYKTALAVRAAVRDQLAHLIDYFFSIEIASAVIACKSAHIFTHPFRKVVVSDALHHYNYNIAGIKLTV